MRRLLILLAILVISAGTSWSQQCTEETPCPKVARLGPWMGGGVPVGTCTTPSIGANFTEGFEGTGYDEAVAGSWADLAGGGGDEDAAIPAALTNGCSQAFYVNVAGTAIGIKWDHGSGINPDAPNAEIEYTAWIYVATGPDTGEIFTIMAYNYTDNFGSGIYTGAQIYNPSASIQIRGTGASNSAFATISATTWTKVTLHIDNTAASCYLSINGDTACAGATDNSLDTATCKNFTRNDTASDNLRWFYIGGVEGVGAADSAQIYFDLVSY